MDGQKNTHNRIVVGVTIRFVLGLDVENAQPVQHGGHQNGHQAERGDILDHDVKQFFQFELSVEPHFIGNGLYSNHVSHKDTGQKGHNGHQHRVAEEIEKVQNGHAAQEGDAAPNAESQAGR